MSGHDPLEGAALYETMGANYVSMRRSDPRWMGRIEAALDDAATVLNVGAGTGSYESAARRVVALEPSEAMIARRPARAAPVVRGAAERLPFPDASFDAVTAVFTVHHWRDRRAGLAECRRVARERVVVVTMDPDAEPPFWLYDYFRAHLSDDRARLGAVDALLDGLGGARVETLPVPHDCVDGFMAAYWRRPDAYLDPAVRAAISWFTQMDPGIEAAGVARLARELEDGTWEAAHGHLRALEELEAGYRLVIAER